VGSTGVDPYAQKIAQTAQLVEMNLSTIGSDVRSTRLGYKNQQKIKAFELMAHLADNLGIILIMTMILLEYIAIKRP
jgi:hypothetical protein